MDGFGTCCICRILRGTVGAAGLLASRSSPGNRRSAWVCLFVSSDWPQSWGDLAEGCTKVLGIAYQGDTRIGGHGPPFHYRIVVVPCWMFVVVLALLPAWRMWTLVKRVPSGSAVCRSCGYDLRATPERCPECGTI